LDYLISSWLKRLITGSFVEKAIKNPIAFGMDVIMATKLLSHSLGLSSTWDMKLIERCPSTLKKRAPMG
jgi:hypothetical protein